MRVLRPVSFAAVVGALSCFALVGTAGAGPSPVLASPVTINKVVVGTAPAGTTFTVTLNCDDIIDGPNTTQATVTFDATGAPTSNNVIGFDGFGACVITETANGNATSTSYACTGTAPMVDPEPPTKESVSADGAIPLSPCAIVGATGVNLQVFSTQQSATVTVTNTFTTPDPGPQVAAEVLVQPNFTG